jgi:demethylspheroidene O-methyltransferase
MGSGRPRTPAELGRMLRDACFERVRQVPTHRPILTQVLVAQRAR